MSAQECDEFLEIAEPRVRRSTVIDSVTGESKVDPIRTSEQTFLPRGKFPIVSRVEERLARITMLPAYHGEDMQVLKYQPGQKYDAHHDVGELSSKSGAQLAADGATESRRFCCTSRTLRKAARRRFRTASGSTPPPATGTGRGARARRTTSR